MKALNDNFPKINGKLRPYFNEKLAATFLEIVINHPEYDFYLLNVINNVLEKIKTEKTGR